jgi:hypothetical protein
VTKPPRPQKVTSACLFIGISCGLLLFYVSSWLGSWNSLEVQDGLASVLAGIDLDALGMTSQGTIDLLRQVLMVMVVPLVAGGVFAVYAARGHLQSRAMLSGIAVLAALVFVVTGGFIGLIPAAFAVASVTQLWSRESRVWFAAVNGREIPESLVRSQAVAAPPDPFAAGQTAVAPDPAAPDPAVPPATAQPAVETSAPGYPVASSGLPTSIRTLAIVTFIATGVVVTVSAIYVAVYMLARESLTRAQLESPVRSMMDSTDAEIIDAMRVAATICGITVVLGVAALVSTWLVIKQHAFGYLALTVLSGVTIIMGLFTLVGLPWSGAAIWVIVLLRRAESRRWVGAA